MNEAQAVPKLTVRREIAAPAQELFDAWLDPAKLAVFMRPSDTKRSAVKVDPRVGGAFEVVMHTPSGTVPHTGTYREIDRPRRLVFTWNSPYALHNDSLVTVEFRPAGKGTEIVLTHEGLPTKEAVSGHTKGWSDILVLLGQGYEETRASA
jgi:uncharacterized protein YndB with AHSA1/START domain